MDRGENIWNMRQKSSAKPEQKYPLFSQQGADFGVESFVGAVLWITNDKNISFELIYSLTVMASEP